MKAYIAIATTLLLSACVTNTPVKETPTHTGNNQTREEMLGKQDEQIPAPQKEPTPIAKPTPTPVPTPNPTPPSSALMKAKCVEMGRSEFTETTTAKDWIHYNFYFSPVLDTCVVEKMMDRLVNDDVGSWYVLFDMLAPEGSERELISWYSWCLDGTNPSNRELKCATKTDYDAEKARILPNY